MVRGLLSEVEVVEMVVKVGGGNSDNGDAILSVVVVMTKVVKAGGDDGEAIASVVVVMA